jgi:TP901 family phage tail tape measure protein
MGRANKTLGVTTGLVRGLGGAMATMLGPMAGIFGIFRLASSGEKFNRSMRSSLAIMGEVSETMRTEMRTVAIETAKVTIHSAEATARAYFFLTSAGMTAAQSIEALPAVAQFAQAGMFDLSRATELATDAQHALGIAVKDPIKNLQSLTRVMDVLVKANTLADATTEQFATALTTKAGAAFKIVGKSVEEAVAVLAALAMAGVKGEEAGTQLSRVMLGLKINAINNADAFKRLGIDVFDSADDMSFMADVVNDLEKSLGGMNDRAKQTAIMALGFTKRTSDLIALLLGKGDLIREFFDELKRGGGTMKEVADNQMTPFQKGWAALSGEASRFASMVMTAVGPALQATQEWLSGAFKMLVLSAKGWAELGERIEEAMKPFLEFMAMMKGIKEGTREWKIFVGELDVAEELQSSERGMLKWRNSMQNLMDTQPITPAGELVQTIDDGIQAMVDKWHDAVRDIGKSPLQIQLETIRAGIPGDKKFDAFRQEVEGLHDVLKQASQGADDWSQVFRPAADRAERMRNVVAGLREELRLFGLTGRERAIEAAAGPFGEVPEEARRLGRKLAANDAADRVVKLTEKLRLLRGEVTRDQLELDKLAKAGISKEQIERIRELQRQIAGEERSAGPRFAAGTQKGTAEAVSQILAAVGGGKKDKALEAQKQIADNTKQMDEKLGRIIEMETDVIDIPPGGAP